MTPEERAQDLLAEAARGATEVFGAGTEASAARKAAADLLVRQRLARYADEGRTLLELSNPGRYWALNGGYMAFLRDDPEKPGRGRNPELEQLRMSYMSLRMRTFWWSFGISVASFLMSCLSLYVALRYGGALLAGR